MTSIDFLPPELLSDILDHLCGTDRLFRRQRDLRSCALVCRGWRDPAKRALFADVRLAGTKKVWAFMRSPARPKYHTTRLVLSDASRDPLDIDVALSCLTLLGPSLSSLAVSIRTDDGGYSLFSNSCLGGTRICTSLMNVV